MAPHPSTEPVQRALRERGFDFEVREFPDSTRTAADAARAVGCDVSQICKSLVFRTEAGRAVLIIASGAHRVDEGKLAEAVGERIGKADAEFVRRATGFAIGGVPPVGHTTPIPTYLHALLVDCDEGWAAAGTPNAVFRLAGHHLLDLTSGTVLVLA